jgi:chromate transport protein ChrA
MAVHFLFIYTLFVKGPEGMDASGGDLTEVARLFVGLWPALAALFISHAYSFFTNFLGRREYRNRTVKDQMSEPYSRIVFMQLVLIVGGGLSMALGQAEPVLVAVIGLKIYFDVRAHIREHDHRRKGR